MICYNWTPKRCTAPAAYWLIQPDGKRNPGGWICANHGQAIVAEYAAKLGEHWTLQPIDEHGRAVD
jgi:hypothetical protein